MGKITGIKPVKKGREKRVRILVDGQETLGLLAETAFNEQLKIGQEVSESLLEALAGLDEYQRCFNAAVRYLAYRPRSEREIRQRLQRHGFGGANLEKAVARLKEQGLVDDLAFARYWRDNREAFSPRSRRLTRLELKSKGLAGDIIEQTVGEIDETESAYRAAAKRAPRLDKSDYQGFRRRLGAYLERRGFSYALIEKTVARVWEELKNPVRA